MDLIDDLPKLDGFSVIFVIVDRLSKHAHFVPMKHLYTTLTYDSYTSFAILRDVVRLHGIPESIVSDRNKVFF